ncbi:hypothetical protein [uncultured Methanofollis sp.]|uniref:hypothetical protein n=1 Tax=uncultured Methanofollis sp. TaxID=262500 RepID=UPI0026301FD3|nr:hypothetical protein [uncultured Methanofollis sp.]
MRFIRFIIIAVAVLFAGSVVLGGVNYYQTSEKVENLWKSAEARMNVDFEKQSIAEIKTNLSAAELYLNEIIEIESDLSAPTDTDKQAKDTLIRYAELELEFIQAMNTDFVNFYRHTKEAETYIEKNEIRRAKNTYYTAIDDLKKFTSKTNGILNNMKTLNIEPLDTETKIIITSEINYLEEFNRELKTQSAELQEAVYSIP